MDSRTVGILGGGQLGRMLVEAAHRLNVKVVILDAPSAPAKQIDATHPHINGSFNDPESIRQLAAACDIITAEIEHVNTTVLEEVESSGVPVEGRRHTVEVQPHWRTLRVIQDKYLQKEHVKHVVHTARAAALSTSTAEHLASVVAQFGLPCMLKSRTQAYDGRGNYPIRTTGDIPAALNALQNRPLYVEEWVAFKCELAVMVVKTTEEPASERDEDDEKWRDSTIAYPVVETVQENSICKLVYAPAPHLSQEVCIRAEAVARQAVAVFEGKGVFGVEMFLLDDGQLLVNEIAPRPHNSGHYTIEACAISQYDAHLRAILGLPFPQVAGAPTPGLPMAIPGSQAIMLNILGGAQPDSHLELAQQAMTTPGASLHLYGKGDARPGRKMGHITVLRPSLAEGEASIKDLVEMADRIRLRSGRGAGPRSGIEVASSGAGFSGLRVGGPGPAGGPAASVAITMGSDSDLPILKPGIALLRELGIPVEVTITSAHRTPRRMFEFARAAASRGTKVIIAAAGGSAHLPGMVASSTPLPVIGVPVKLSALDGLDSLLSIVQMPRGVPVATVGINNSVNAALLAARILGISDGRIKAHLEQYAETQERDVLEKAETLESEGWDRYDAAG
ncbi:MAG: phosphoribosylaminoimidazole carboxylase ade2 [Phylliscum demangeonii]|nr:MAG: phosphoribosylaminoimidazole carboxylase ade2 [Phylliscum demangeonii]